MSIEKLDSATIRQQQKSFTSFFNVVLQNITDGFILGLFCYLSSLPPSWKVNRQQLMDHFGVGRDKIGAALKWLNDHNLLEYEQIRNPDGTMLRWEIVVKDGLDFINNFVNKQYDEKLSTETPSTLLKNQCLDNPVSGKSAPINNINNINNINTKKGNVDNYKKPSNEPRCTVSEWGPGHPTWDALHKPLLN